MPEHDCLPPDISATEFVVHMARMSGLPRTAARERAADTLRHVGLQEERYRPIGGYSTGMRQRVKLAQALVHDPQLIFLDEPTNGLDPQGRDDMLALIRRIGTEFGISVLVTSHLLGELERVCDHVIVIDGGRLLRSSAIREFTQTTHAVAIEVEDGLEPLAERLGRMGEAVTVQGRLLTVQVPADADPARTLMRCATPSAISTSISSGWSSAAAASRMCSGNRAEGAGDVMSSEPTAVIHDIGYRRYEGPRQGRAGACTPWPYTVSAARSASAARPAPRSSRSC